MLLCLLQVAQQGKTGLWLLRPAWRAAYWALTELPAHLEAMLPATPVVPLSAAKPVPDHAEIGAQSAWALAAGAANSSSWATHRYPHVTVIKSAAESVCGLADQSAAF